MFWPLASNGSHILYWNGYNVDGSIRWTANMDKAWHCLTRIAAEEITRQASNCHTFLEYFIYDNRQFDHYRKLLRVGNFFSR